MEARPTHSITMSATGRYPHGNAERASVTVEGEGDLDHYVQAFAALLVASGFSSDTAAKFIAVEE